jgi:hypothetical protein
MSKAEYDFPVEIQDIYLKNGVKLAKNKAVVRTDSDTSISVVSSKYNLIRHTEVMDAVMPFMRQFGDAVEKITTEKDGARVVATYDFKNKTIVGPKVGDVIGLRIHGINSYDRSGLFCLKIGGMVLQCKNGMTLLGRDAMVLTYRHTGKHVDIKLPDPEFVWDQFVAGGKFWKDLGEIEVKQDLKPRITDLVQNRSILSDRSLRDDGVRQQIADSVTAWDLYNAYTYGISSKTKLSNKTSEIVRQDRLNRLFKSAFIEREPALVA